MKLVELSISLLNLICDMLILRNIVCSSILNCFLKSFVLISDHLLLLLLLINLSLHFSHLLFKRINVLVILRPLIFHLFLGLGSHIVCLSQRLLSHSVIFLDVLIHVFELVKISELFFFVIDNILLLCVNRLNNHFSFVVKICIHTLNIISFCLKFEKTQVFFLFLFDINGGSILSHASLWIITKSKEVTKDIVFRNFP